MPNNIRVLKNMIVFYMLILMICSCSTNQPEISKDLQRSFQALIAISDTNSSFSIRVMPNEKNENRFGDNVIIRVENIGKKKIFFPVDSSVARIFIIRDNKWVEIKNTAKYFSLQNENGSILYPEGGEQLNIFITGVTPVLDSSLDKGGQEIMRILIVGELMDEDKKTGIPVAAYIDLFMMP